jgi:hypothetical protein
MARSPYKKKKIPRAVREAVWLHHCGRKFERRCLTPWCKNNITAFDFQTGHNIPESKGGATTVDNLVPLCSRCNLSMGNQYTFQEWSAQFVTPTATPWWRRVLGYMTTSRKITPLKSVPRQNKHPSSTSSSPLAAPLGIPQSSSDSSSTSS